MSWIDDLYANAEHIEKRIFQDILNEACAGYWRHRAAMFQKVGNARCDEIAEACRNRARVALLGGEEW